ncbi:SEL1-like repeat protein [Leminorella grimontii]|uniref:tetratricopeptide repeat protein n=1 Tax=Leminorella grimontii TaxID=82981 RepID=UPI0032202294
MAKGIFSFIGQLMQQAGTKKPSQPELNEAEIEKLQQRVEQGDAAAFEELVTRLGGTIPTYSEDEQGDEEFQDTLDLAKAGIPEAQYNVAVSYENGQSIEENLDLAIYWYEQAGELGLVEAQDRVARVYAIKKRDDEAAVKWFRKAAEQNYAAAQYALGLYYESGEVVKRDPVKACDLFRKAAEQGNAEAQHMLGGAYRTGNGVEQNGQLAHYWLLRAAEQDEASAQCDLAGMYFEGKIIERDMEQVFYWSQKSAQLGNAAAQNNLGYLYFQGEGVEKNNLLAYAWVRVAEISGSKASLETKKDIEQELDAKTLKAAQALAQEYIEKYTS